MELHDYLEHGYRVLSNNGNSDIPEILEYAADVDFQGLDKDKVVELRLAGNKDNELYRLLIVAQCNALHKAMPFLFERIDSETELLLPDNLLHSHSPIRKMVNEIDEEDWNDVEIIGWIYQFYISERKDEVIGKVVKSEDIPAATQLFTPNWIVKYMVQNTLGRMWLATYPDSPLKNKMDYYIEPAEQEPVVQEQFDAITPKELNPEEITFLDPACGSGHIFVEAYDILKEIYLERGYRTKDIPCLILEKNLFGLDIDDRAAQLACFAVLMRARKDDRKILSRKKVQLNILAIQGSKKVDANTIAKNLIKEKTIYFSQDDQFFPEFKGQLPLKTTLRPDLNQADITELINIFNKSKTLGSLIKVNKEISKRLPLFEKFLYEKIQKGDLFESEAAYTALPFYNQALLLSRKFDCVVTNPPYMGGNGMNPDLKNFARKNYPNSKQDLYGIFIERLFEFIKKDRSLGVMSPITWLVLKSYENLRKDIIDKKCFLSLIKPEYHSFFDSAYVPICCFTILKKSIRNFKPTFIDLADFYGANIQSEKAREAIKNKSCKWRYTVKTDEFKVIPTNPFAYSINSALFEAFAKNVKIGSDAKKGTTTGDNNRFLRLWPEVDIEKFSKFGGQKWFPMTKGGPYRKWYGNFEHLVNWENNGYEICNFKDSNGKLRSAPRNLKFNFCEGITWNDVTVSDFSARYVPKGFVFNAVGPMIFGGDIEYRLCMLNSKVNTELLKVLCPTMKFEVGAVSLIPVGKNNIPETEKIAQEAIEISKNDWDSFEMSWDFECHPLLSSGIKQVTVEQSLNLWKSTCNQRIKKLQSLETKSNSLFIESYRLQEELYLDVSADQITLNRANRESDIKGLVSYAIGCMMGRYSLDRPGLIFAISGNEGFDSSKYSIFPADDDGIIPIMDQQWFPDDATNRFVEFLRVAWSPETIDENIKFVAESLKPRNNETPVDTIRRYLSTSFFRDHIKTYKKRPIYWLFSSGKYKAFECLVYLHRYNESTLSRIRSTYVTPLQGNISARLEFLQNEKDAAGTASAQRKFQKEIDILRKKQTELSAFDDELRHYSDMKISLDLDDGVKVNYGKFGNLLAEKKTITGKK